MALNNISRTFYNLRHSQRYWSPTSPIAITEYKGVRPVAPRHNKLSHERLRSFRAIYKENSHFYCSYQSEKVLMALLPYLLDELRPRRIRDRHYTLDLSNDDFLQEILEPRRYIRPWRNLLTGAQDVGTTIKSDKDKFQINLDVQHFAPEEISVKTSDGFVVIEGKHEEKKDEHGFISRQFKRRYALPEGCNVDTVESKLSSDGVLSVIAPKYSESRDERAVPITQTGPVRRKAHEEDEEKEANGAVEEAKSPQKKRRR